MVRRPHPFVRALPAALAIALLTVLGGTWPVNGIWRFSDFPSDRHIFAAAIIAGSFLAAAPVRLRRRARTQHSSWQGCLTAFLGGLVMTLALALTGTDSISLIAGTMQGSLGALAFVGVAWLFAGITARLTRGGIR